MKRVPALWRCVVVALAALMLPARDAEASTVRAVAPRTVPVYVQWMRVVPGTPLTLYAGGALHCADLLHGHTCRPWIMRSTDGGATWSDLSVLLGEAASWPQESFSPLLMSQDGAHLYFDVKENGGGAYHLVRSSDAGLHWSVLPPVSDGYYGAGSGGLAFSPAAPRRLYAESYLGSEGGYVIHSDDGGASWTPRAMPPSSGAWPAWFYGLPWSGLVADPLRPATVYANLYSSQAALLKGLPLTTVQRSDDAGLHWTQVMTPTASPPLRSFLVGTNPHDGTLLVGRSLDASVPPDRRWLSGDGGRTWRAGTCPGDLFGACPRFMLDNVFGDGASYAFLPGGVYTFNRRGPATKRLAIISARLPLPVSDLLDVEGGSRAGDPVYLLGKGRQGNVQGVLYHSLDGGHSWQQLTPGVLPNLAPPSLAVETLYVPATNHSVAAPFVDTYVKTNTLILGNPVTEAYTEGETLRQDFDHLSLEWRHGQVVAGQLGAELAGTLYAGQPVPPLPADLRRFWQAHGGAALLGPPISGLVYSSNGDGSGRKYYMVWCRNARLERHPENADPRYSILLGLLGHDALKARGWVL